LGRVFGTAGVRGIFNRTQTPEQVYRLVETAVFTFGRGGYGVGWDGRKTSALLARTAMSAVSTVGSDVLCFGSAPTPVVAFGTRSRSCFAGFCITASHNPAEFSGVKVFNRKGMELSEQEEDRIERALTVDAMKPSGSFGQFIQDDGVIDDYVEALSTRFDPASTPLSIAAECATGPGGAVTPRVLKLLGYRVVAVNAQASWRFPARPPEPTPGNLAEFARIIPSLGVDFGFVHDGDADRLVMVSRGGRVLPDAVVSILALRSLSRSKGLVVISENMSTAVEEEARKLGFRVMRSRVGKTFATLETEGGVFASEPSKVVDPAWGLWEDGINAAVAIACLLSREPGLLERTAEELKWHYRQVNLNVKVKMPMLVEKAKETFKKFRISEERTLDGYKLVFHDGSWVMFRPSGTEPKTRVYCESEDPQVLEVLAQQGTQCVESSL
jgi:phosphomannomutase